MNGMETALATELFKVAAEKLFALLASEFTSIMSVKKDLSELKDTLELITSRLSAIQDREIESDPSFRWVQKLNHLAYDIGDLLDYVQLQAEKHNIESDGDKHAVADFFCARPKLLKFRCKVAHKIKKIKARLAEIVKQTSDMNTIMQNLPMAQPVSSRNNATAELYLLGNVEESKIPRRDHERDKIISKLVESNEGESVLIVSIVGIGGSGKTTLTKQICHDEKIEEHFKDTIFRVHVSEKFDVDSLIGKLFEAITKQKSDLHPRAHKLHVISNKLCENKFLLVLDDAWHKNRHDWEQFMLHVKRGKPGSRILLTTRHEEVADVVESWYKQKLLYLSEPESWGFFLKVSGWTEDEGSELIQVGKDIVNKCGGVPLAIKILGGVLRGKSEINTLRAISGSTLWNDKNIDDQVFACLKLSYIHLENYLKQCCTYCSIFPKGYEINKDHLIAQWIAHGFINPRNEERAEDIGSEYCDSLMKAGFLQDTLTGYDEAYRMHDLIHDLTRQILQHEMVTSLNNMSKDSTRRCRYLSLHSSSDEVDRDLCNKVRAIYVAGGNPTFDKRIKKGRSVRSVILHYETDTPFPLFILKFEYIGYLEIRNVSCAEIPEAISGCWNLQSLHFINCNGFVTLPESVGKLKKLRSLQLDWIDDLERLPQSIGDCRTLQSLQVNYCPKLTEVPYSIGRLDNLRVLHIENCISVQQLPSEPVWELSNIETINLAGCQSLQGLPSTVASRTLRTLNLFGTRVTTLPPWVTSIHTLECLNLEGCSELVELPRDITNLKRLKVLCIRWCSKLRCMPPGFGQLTRLTRLGFFHVGCSEDDARILELENLNMISGQMEITNLKYVRDPGDAKKACLKRKNNIQSLVLEWSTSGVEEELLSDKEQDLGVLNALEPPAEVEELTIKGYRGLSLPQWMVEESDPSYQPGIMLNQTSQCQFLRLTQLTLERMPNLKHVRGLVELPSLKLFWLDGMRDLEELWITTTGFETGEDELVGQNCLPVLCELFIFECPKLNVKPYFPPSLEQLDLRGSNEQLLNPRNFCHLPPPRIDESSSSSSAHSAACRLKILELEEMTGSSSGWNFLQHLTGLECLKIDSCDDLTQLPESIRSLTSLCELYVLRCPTLGVLPEWLGELRSLEVLSIWGTPMIDTLPQSTQHLTSLKWLAIIGWGNLKQLPEVIQQLNSLQHLNLSKCGALTVLPEWIGQLSALESLEIMRCSALQSLPRSIQRLTALRRLFIACCPDLARRYKQGVGDDWQLVSHIPDLRIFD